MITFSLEINCSSKNYCFLRSLSYFLEARSTNHEKTVPLMGWTYYQKQAQKGWPVMGYSAPSRFLLRTDASVVSSRRLTALPLMGIALGPRALLHLRYCIPSWGTTKANNWLIRG